LLIASQIEYHSGSIVHVTTQIAVRLPDDLVTYVDQLVRDGAGSRAAVLTRALTMYRQHVTAERDARILEEQGDYDDFDGLTSYGKIDVD
jgi:Arc/MetJ-type ribon-helix-helix transcriptional regulator